MKVHTILNTAGHELLDAIHVAQCKILEHDDSRQDVRIQAIVRLNEIQKKVNREMSAMLSQFDRMD